MLRHPDQDLAVMKGITQQCKDSKVQILRAEVIYRVSNEINNNNKKNWDNVLGYLTKRP